MARPIWTNAAIVHEIGAIEADISTILQFMRQVSTGGYVVEPEGVAVMESMVFATSLRVSQLGTVVRERLNEFAEVARAADVFANSVERGDARVAELASAIRQAVTRQAGARSLEEARAFGAVIRESVLAIEDLVNPDTVTDDNVLQFTPRAPAPDVTAPEGGAA